MSNVFKKRKKKTIIPERKILLPYVTPLPEGHRQIFRFQGFASVLCHLHLPQLDGKKGLGTRMDARHCLPGYLTFLNSDPLFVDDLFILIHTQHYCRNIFPLGNSLTLEHDAGISPLFSY